MKPCQGKNCDKQAPKGERYCWGCRRKMKAAMVRSKYLEKREK